MVVPHSAATQRNVCYVSICTADLLFISIITPNTHNQVQDIDLLHICPKEATGEEHLTTETRSKQG